MFNFLKNRNSHPPTVSTDIVSPIGQFDDTILQRHGVVCTTFLFNEVLDVSKLRDSLESLIERDGWCKLGARLRRNHTTGCLEHHIPAKFTKDRPALRFHHVEHHMARADHPMASQLPEMTTEPAVMADPDEFEALWHHPDIPTKLGHYLQRDEPQVSLFIVSFDDATLVMLNWSHLLFDALGMGEVLRAWSLMLQGRPDEVSKPHGTDHDPLVELGRHPTEPHKLESLQLGWLALVIYGLRIIFQLLYHKHQTRTILIPAPYLRKLRDTALLELSDEIQGDTKPFVSEGDLLSAWWAQVNVAYLSKGPHKLVHIMNVLGWRPSLADMLPSNQPYICNAVGLMSVMIPSEDFFSKPLSHVAWKIRQCINESRSREQVEAYAALWLKSSSKIPPLFGNATMHVVGCTNWAKAKLFELDFSAAIVKHGNTVSSALSGRPCYTQSCIRGGYVTNALAILGKDSKENYWMVGHTNTEHWARIEEAIAKIGDMEL